MAKLVDRTKELEDLVQKKTTTVAEVDEARAEIDKLRVTYQEMREDYKQAIRKKASSGDSLEYPEDSERILKMDYVYIAFNSRQFLRRNYGSMLGQRD